MTDWNRLEGLSDADIRKGIESDPDAHPTDKKFWTDAKVVLPRPKAVVTVRLDADLLEWFRRKRGYQTRINAILRAYMNANVAPSFADLLLAGPPLDPGDLPKRRPARIARRGGVK